jgi:Family of unknown function (DUF6263)
MKRIYITALLAATLTACNDRPADATVTGATTNDTTNTISAVPAPDSPAAAEPVQDVTLKEGEVLLRLNYPKGFKQEVYFGVVTKTAALNGTTGITVAYTVTGEANGVYTFGGAITGINMVSEVQGQKINYDSSKKLPANATKTEQAIDKGFKDVQNKPFTFKLDKTGSIEQDIQFESQNDGMQPVDLGNFQIPFPEEPVAVGANWSAKSADKQTGGTRYNTYTVKKIADDVVVIDVKSVLPPPVNMKGAKESVFTGAYTLDRKTGMLLKGSLSGFIESLGGNVTMIFTGKKK